MSLYAYLPYEEGKRVQHKTGEIFLYEGDEVWLFQSTKMTSEERDLLKKHDSGRFKCFSCGEDMKFVANSIKNNCFSHFHKKDCTLPESFEHAITKLKIYNLFKESGYIPKLERVFKSIHADYNPRADVFVEAITGNEKIVVEVQANNNIHTNTVAKRTMAYAMGGIPTAWVLILESYFKGKQYAGTTITEVIKHEDGTSSNEVRSLRYDEDGVFTVSGNPKSFNQLMDAYGYIIAVNYEGHFFLIRQDVFSKGDVYRISRIPHENLVEVLLTTDLVELDYHYVPKKKAVQEKGDFEGQEGFEHEEEGESSNISLNGIDFDMAYQIEQERLMYEGKLDPLTLLRQLKAVRKFNQRDKEREMLSEQREKINEKKYKSGIESLNRDAEKALIGKERLNTLLTASLRQKENQEEAIYKRVYEDKINQWKISIDNEQKKDVRLLKHLKKLRSELEQKWIGILDQVESRSQKEEEERKMILAEIKTMKHLGGKHTQLAIEQVEKAYGDLNNQTEKELTISLNQIKPVYSQENKGEVKKSIDQLQQEERIYRANSMTLFDFLVK
ncbi:competence protein CoiA family protein [Lysinibacillus xylanilyticus]|uniref:competence protein CoiA family protein n=1 Tax=Lysinibacillus xylanilyticus TaxID=582475 RepID=UPI002E248827|nr:competence protein CoiA family protein [Lysinibacillus xylanilyticus]